MGQERTVATNIITGLEVSGLQDDAFITLPETYTQSRIPVTKSNIPNQRALSKWPYLREVQISTINAGIDLLIGTQSNRALANYKQ